VSPYKLFALAIIAALTLPYHSKINAAWPERLLITTQEWPPYQTYSSETITGLAVNRLKCVLRQLEQPYKITMMNWEDAQLSVQNEQQDAFFVAEQTQASDKYAVFSSPLIYHQWAWYFSNSLKSIKLTDDTKLKWQVAAEFGTGKWFFLQENGYNSDKKPRNIKALTNMLMHNEVDAILVDKLAMQIELKALGMINNSFRSQTMASKPLGVYFNKSFINKHPEFLTRFNQIIPECIK
jgi:ABC-type amino acid transport substrate-binding protein